jgi:hypothetical protein
VDLADVGVVQRRDRSRFALEPAQAISYGPSLAPADNDI